MDLVVIRWDDATKDESVDDLDNGYADKQPVTVDTVGYLLDEDKNRYVVAATIDHARTKTDSTGARGVWVIPRGMVKKVTRLAEAKQAQATKHKKA